MGKIHRLKFTFSFLVFLNTISPALRGQEIPVIRTVTKAIQNHTRNKVGTPGSSYWQNSADYTIALNFDPSSRNLKGKAHILYMNNSPDTLKKLIFKLYPNFYKSDAMRNMPIAPDDLGEGMAIHSISIGGEQYDETRRKIRGTNMYLTGVTVLPGKHLDIEIDYEYQLNKGSFVRTGQVDSGSFFIAYFFPRITVYDDIDGWNEYPYIGKEEFYNDYGNFQVSITVPGNYQVWATGDLKNPESVFQSAIRDRLKQAEKGDEIIDIVTPTDLRNLKVTQKNKVNTWKFRALNVTDFAFGLSDHYVWQSGSVLVDSVTGRRSRIDAVFNPAHASYYKVADYAAKTVKLISNHFPKIPFPYPHQTIFDGLDAMEYPMMVNNLPFGDHNDLLELSVHEVFHSIFPFYVGTNETKYSFMDEGWATFSEFYLSPMIDSTLPLNYNISDANSSAGTAEDMPLITPSPQLYGKARYADKDLKPALANLYLREMLGHQLFVKAVQNYIKSWAGKHPTPYDFFNSLEHSSGNNLQWFWKNWYLEKNVPDLSISKVRRVPAGYRITISSPGTLAVPIHLSVHFRDGTTENVAKDMSCWRSGNKEVIIFLKHSGSISSIDLGNTYDMDINPDNNHWKNNASSSS